MSLAMSLWFNILRFIPSTVNEGGEPIYYHGPNEMCIIAGEQQNQMILF